MTIIIKGELMTEKQIETALKEDYISEIAYMLERIRLISRFKLGRTGIVQAINKKWGIALRQGQ